MGVEIQFFHPSRGLMGSPSPLFSFPSVTGWAPREEVAKQRAGAWRTQVEASVPTIPAHVPRTYAEGNATLGLTSIAQDALLLMAAPRPVRTSCLGALGSQPQHCSTRQWLSAGDAWEEAPMA